MCEMRAESAGVITRTVTDATEQRADDVVSRELCLLSASILLHVMQLDGQCRLADADDRGNRTGVEHE